MAFDPSSRDLHVDSFLTNLTIGYTNAAYIADQVFAPVPVNKQSDIIPKFNQSAWFRDSAKIRGVGTKSVRTGWTVDSSAHYFCPRYSLAHEIPDETRDNADQPWNLDVESVEFVTDKMLMHREVQFASKWFTTSKWGASDVTGNSTVSYWSDYANGSPLLDLTTYADTIEGNIGRMPNKLILGKQVWSQLKWHPDLVDTIKYTERGIPGPDLLAEAIGFDSVLIGAGIYTTSPEGTAEASVTYSRIWGKAALMLYTPDHPSLMTPAAGYNFVWARVAGAQQYIKRMRDEEREVDIIEGNSYFDQEQTAKNAGQYFATIVA